MQIFVSDVNDFFTIRGCLSGLLVYAQILYRFGLVKKLLQKIRYLNRGFTVVYYCDVVLRSFGRRMDGR